MSAATGPGRKREMSTTRSWKVAGWSRPTRSRWPGDSIWKQPSVSVDRMSPYVSGSPSGTASRSIRSPVARSTSVTACAIADCIRTPSTSSLSSPRSSTSSLSNCAMGKPSPLVGMTGVRVSREASDSSTPQGCMAMPRGSASRASTSSHSLPYFSFSPASSRSSGSSSSAARASRARMCGKDLATRSISAGSMDSAAPTSRTAWRTR